MIRFFIVWFTFLWIVVFLLCICKSFCFGDIGFLFVVGIVVVFLFLLFVFDFVFGNVYIFDFRKS